MSRAQCLCGLNASAFRRRGTAFAASLIVAVIAVFAQENQRCLTPEAGSAFIAGMLSNIRGNGWEIDSSGCLKDTRSGVRWIGKFHSDGAIADTRSGTAWVGKIHGDGQVADTRSGTKWLGKLSPSQIVDYFWDM